MVSGGLLGLWLVVLDGVAASRVWTLDGVTFNLHDDRLRLGLGTARLRPGLGQLTKIT